MKLVTTEKKEKDPRKALEENFKQSLRDFIEDDSYFPDYKGYIPLGDKVLIRLFKFTPREDLKEHLGKTEILLPGVLDGNWKPKIQALSEKIFPIAKVIRKGMRVNEDFIKEGGVYTVPYEEVLGTQWNPDFLHLVQTFAGKSGNQGKLVNIPEDMPQKLPKMAIEWARYKFSMPDRLGKETEDDKLTFLIPTIKLESIYEFD